MITVQWLPYREFLIDLREIDGEWLAFHSGTGQTHLLSHYAEIVISLLSNCTGPMSSEEIKVSGGDDFSELRLADLNEILRSLFELSLVTKIESD